FTGTTSQPVSLCWTLLKFPSDLPEATYRLSTSHSMSEFREAAAMIPAPGLSVIYADRDDNVAWWSAAKFVKRPGHVNPLLLLDGWSGSDDWMGFYDFSENP